MAKKEKSVIFFIEEFFLLILLILGLVVTDSILLSLYDISMPGGDPSTEGFGIIFLSIILLFSVSFLEIGSFYMFKRKKVKIKEYAFMFFIVFFIFCLICIYFNCNSNFFALGSIILIIYILSNLACVINGASAKEIKKRLVGIYILQLILSLFVFLFILFKGLSIENHALVNLFFIIDIFWMIKCIFTIIDMIVKIYVIDVINKKIEQNKTIKKYKKNGMYYLYWSFLFLLFGVFLLIDGRGVKGFVYIITGMIFVTISLINIVDKK